MFAIFDSIDEFNTWHSAIKIKLGYPLFGKNALSGEIDLLHPTTEYTAPKLNVNDIRIVAWVGDESAGLTLIDIENDMYKKWQFRYPMPVVEGKMYSWDESEQLWQEITTE